MIISSNLHNKHMGLWRNVNCTQCCHVSRTTSLEAVATIHNLYKPNVVFIRKICQTRAV
jgi:hypothetical protein